MATWAPISGMVCASSFLSAHAVSCNFLLHSPNVAVPGNARLSIPPLHLEDGPQGVADGTTKVTAWPSALTVIMSWDENLVETWGAAMGAEQAAKGTNVMLGPAVNLARVPWAGRNFEYMGEDPVLAARMVAREVAGIQSNGITGCIKHWVNNNQEYDRRGVSAVVGQRVAFETYYVPFAAAVDAGVGSASACSRVVLLPP
jgi:beta-glucosidase